MILHWIRDARASSLSQNGALQRPRATRITNKSSGGATLTARFVHCVAKQSPQGTSGTSWATPGCYWGDFSMIIAWFFMDFWIDLGCIFYCFSLPCTFIVERSCDTWLFIPSRYVVFCQGFSWVTNRLSRTFYLFTWTRCWYRLVLCVAHAMLPIPNPIHMLLQSTSEASTQAAPETRIGAAVGNWKL